MLPATQSLPIWEAYENYEYALRLDEERLAAENNPVMSDTTATTLPRGRKRQAVGLPAPEQHQLIEGVVHTLSTYQDELQQALRQDDPAPAPARSSAAPSASTGQELPIDPVASGTGLPIYVADSSSTDSQHTLAPPFPTSDGTHD